MFAMKKLILFDLDGTLLDTLEDLSAAVNYALGLRGLPLHSVDEYRSMVGHGVRNLVQQALDASLSVMPDYAVMPGPDRASEALVDATLADFVAYYRTHIDVHTRPYPGIPELLSDRQARGVRLAVASNKFQEGTEYLVRHFFPDIQFVAILGNRPGWPLKPSPELVQEVLLRAGVAPSDALLVGDSPTDMRTAANGGIDALAVTWGYRSAEELEPVLRELFPGGAERLVNSVPELRIGLLDKYMSGRDLTRID